MPRTPTQKKAPKLEKLAAKLLDLQKGLEELQNQLSDNTEIAELVEKTNKKRLIMLMNKNIADLEKKISNLRQEIRDVEEEVVKTEKMQAVA